MIALVAGQNNLNATLSPIIITQYALRIISAAKVGGNYNITFEVDIPNTYNVGHAFQAKLCRPGDEFAPANDPNALQTPYGGGPYGELSLNLKAGRTRWVEPIGLINVYSGAGLPGGTYNIAVRMWREGVWVWNWQVFGTATI